MARQQLIFVFLLLATTSTDARALTFHPIQFPGSKSTMPMAIDGNTIVGQYCDNSICAAFVFDGSTYSRFELPDGSVFGLNGVDGMNVVGLLYDPIQREQRSFWYNGSTTTFVGSHIYNALAIDDGKLVGVRYRNPEGGYQGFIFDGRDFQYAEHPDIVPSLAVLDTVWQDIDDGRALGAYEVSSSHWQSFLYDGTNYTDLPIPVTTPYIPVRGLDGNRIVGRLDNMGFYAEGTTITTFSHPDAVNGTVAEAISGDAIIGWYHDAAGREHGYLLIIPEPETAVTGIVGFAALVVAGGRGRRCPIATAYRTFTG